jgi:hypothetical protein
MQYRGICSQFRGLRDDACICLANSADLYGTGSLVFAFVFMAMLFLMPRLRKMVLKVLKSVQRMLYGKRVGKKARSVIKEPLETSTSMKLGSEAARTSGMPS